MQRKWSFLFIFLIFLIIVSGFIIYQSTKTGQSNEQTVTYNMVFKVFDGNQALPDVSLVIIKTDGQVVDVLKTDSKGEAKKELTVPIDKRFYKFDPVKLKPRGTVTVIAYKKGYRETVLMDTAISEGTPSQSFYMKPLVSGERNEPEVLLGQNHHLEILSLVEKYKRYSE